MLKTPPWDVLSNASASARVRLAACLALVWSILATACGSSPGGVTGAATPPAITLSAPSPRQASPEPPPEPGVRRLCSTDGWCWMNPLPQGNSLRGIWGSGPNDVFAVGDTGTVLHYDGKQWTAMASGVAVALSSVWGTGPRDVYAVGDSGTIIRYDGSKWSSMPSGTSERLDAIWGSGPDDLFVIGYDLLLSQPSSS